MTSLDPRAILAQRLPPDVLERGLQAIEGVHQRTISLVHGRATRVLDHLDYGYAGYYVHLVTPALEAIASEGWVERHLADFVRLAESPVLGECCRATVLELFGVEAFHVAIQHYPLSDGLVRNLCHGGEDKVEHVRRIGGQLVCLRSAYGTYPPPGQYSNDRCSSDAPVFDAIPV